MKYMFETKKGVILSLSKDVRRGLYASYHHYGADYENGCVPFIGICARGSTSL